MSAQQQWALQQAVYARLTAQLAGQGPDSSNVTVYDHAPADPPRVHCRIDGFNTVQRLLKSNNTEHLFNVHFFDRPTSETGSARGQSTVSQLQQTAIAALHDWKPSVTGASEIRHIASDIADDEDGLTAHAISRFTVFIASS